MSILLISNEPRSVTEPLLATEDKRKFVSAASLDHSNVISE